MSVFQTPQIVKQIWVVAIASKLAQEAAGKELVGVHVGKAEGATGAIVG